MRRPWLPDAFPRSPRERALYGAAFALLLAFAFPFRAGELRFDLGAGLGWLAPVPFVWMLRGLRPVAAFRWGVAAATPAFCVILYWIFVVVQVHGHAPAWAGVAVTLLLALALAVHTGATAALHVACAPRGPLLQALTLAAAWVVAEQLRSFDLFGGFPWAYLGYSIHADGAIMELAAVGGIFGLSFLLVTAAGLLAVGRLRAVLALLALAHVAGFGLRLAQSDPDREGSLHVGIVQANISQEQKWDAALAAEAFQKHIEISRLATAAGDVDLIIWPESAVPVFIEMEPAYAAAIRRLADESGAILVIGAPRLERTRDAPGYRIFNSVLAVRPGHGVVDRYDKSHLVPFGEYVPLRGLLGFLSALASGIVPGDVTPGPGPRVLRELPELGPDHALAPLICYEVLYPALVREVVQGGARILLNLTNDAWYERTSAPHQFLAIAAMRSAEHGLPMLRAANTGVSAVVDAGGTVLQETPIFEQRAMRVQVPASRPGPTLYTRFGDWVVWLSWGLLTVMGGVRVVRERQRSREGDPAGAAGARPAGR